MRTLIFASLILAACSSPSTAPRLGDKIAVRFSTHVRIPSDTTTVRFVAVTSDSRCPSDAQCVWAGDAAVVFLVGGTQQVTLHTNEGANSVLVAGRLLTLVSLAPVPKAGSPIAQADYVATVRFDSPKD